MNYRELLKKQIIFFFKLLVLTLFVFGIHYYIFFSFFSEIELGLPLWLVYAVHFVLVYAIFTIINYRYRKGKTEIFNVFMVGTILKMVLVIFFLLPLILSDQKNKIPDVLNFFLPYFIFLGFEVYSIFTFFQKK